MPIVFKKIKECVCNPLVLRYLAGKPPVNMIEDFEKTNLFWISIHKNLAYLECKKCGVIWQVPIGKSKEKWTQKNVKLFFDLSDKEEVKQTREKIFGLMKDIRELKNQMESRLHFDFVDIEDATITFGEIGQQFLILEKRLKIFLCSSAIWWRIHRASNYYSGS